MKNIYILDEHQSSKRNGIGTYLKELIYCLKQLDTTICLVSFNADVKEFNIFTKEDGIKHICFPYLSNNWFTLDYRIIDVFFRLYIQDSSDNIFFINHSPCDKLLEIIKQSHPLSKLLFVIHDFSWTSTLLENANKLKDILLEKDPEFVNKQYPYIVKKIEREQRMYDIADGVISLCGDAYITVRDIYKKTKNIYMIENGYRGENYHPYDNNEKKQIRKKLNLEENEKILLFAARLTTTKAIIPIINAFCKVVLKFPKARLILAGSSVSLENYNNICTLSRKVTSKISFPGQIPFVEMEDWYKAADIGVAATRVEQCSYTGIEMQMYGLPILASDGFGVKDMFTDGINAKVAKIGNSDLEFENNLVRAMLELLNSPEICNTLSMNARKTYESRYCINNMLAAYEKLIYSI